MYLCGTNEGGGGRRLRPGQERLERAGDRAHAAVQPLRKVITRRPAPDDGWRALYVAVTLGPNIRIQRWRAVCTSLGIDGVDGLLVELVQAGLAEETPTVFRLLDEGLASYLEEHARARSLWAAIQAACAAPEA